MSVDHRMNTIIYYRIDYKVLLSLTSFHVFTQLSVLCFGGFITPAVCNRLSLGIARFIMFSCFCLTIIILFSFMMATSSRGQLPARQTKVVDSCPSPLKEGRTHKNRKTGSSDNDVLSSKPTGRGRADDFQDQSGDPSGGYVRKCGRSRCKTCTHITEGRTFVSN